MTSFIERNIAHRRRTRRKEALGVLTVVGLWLVPVAGAGLWVAAWENSRGTHVCTVEDKDRTRKSDGGSDQRIYTDCGVLNVADDALQGQWNSADTYSQIEVGQTYELTTVGWRNGLLTLFPNVISVEIH